MDSNCPGPPVRGARPPLYNMAVSFEDQNPNIEPLWDGVPFPVSLRLDKLILSAVLPCPGEDAVKRVESLGSVSLRPGKGRMHGSRPLLKWWGALWGTVRTPGNVIAEVETLDGSGTSLIRLILNPQKCGGPVVEFMGRVLAFLGAKFRGVWVERYDAALDYRAHRGLFMLDESRSMGDALGLCSYGPQTERIGFRKGSSLRVQLYDKTAERAARANQETEGWVTRFEVQASGLSDVHLADLPSVPCPIPESTAVRVLAFDPAVVADARLAAVGLAARFGGLRYCRKFLRRFEPRMRLDLLDIICPLALPTFHEEFARSWGVEAGQWVRLLEEGMGAGDRPGSYGAAPAPSGESSVSDMLTPNTAG